VVVATSLSYQATSIGITRFGGGSAPVIRSLGVKHDTAAALVERTEQGLRHRVLLLGGGLIVDLPER
jgi:hypothetical protein